MWLGRGIQNQWPAADFHASVTKAVEEDREAIPLPEAEMLKSYLLVLLGIAPPAGNA